MRAAPSERRFTVEEFHRMCEAGILEPGERVELLDGRVLEMAAIGSRHAACVSRLNLLFVEGVGRELIVGVQNPVQLGPRTELVPDLVLLRWRDDFYAEALPDPEDILLVVEVADTTLQRDRRVKIPDYGRAGVPEAWLVDLPGRQVEAWWEPADTAGYGETVIVAGDEPVESRSVPGLAVDVRDVLGVAR